MEFPFSLNRSISPEEIFDGRSQCPRLRNLVVPPQAGSSRFWQQILGRSLLAIARKKSSGRQVVWENVGLDEVKVRRRGGDNGGSSDIAEILS